VTSPAVINHFRGEYGFLSNFSAAKVVYEGEEYPTVEHAFQAAKVDVDEMREIYYPGHGTGLQRWREVIRRAPTPGRAKQLGREAPLRTGWETNKVHVMRELLWQKFAPGRIHLDLLLNTGDASLIEGNTWGDTYWGVCDGKGLNMLGQLLMDVRAARRRMPA